MTNAIEIKKLYLEFMEKRGWPIRKSGKLVDSTFPHCFTISGAVDWFNHKITNDPSTKEGYAYCVRCFRHYDIPDETHLPFFWMLLDVSWSLHSREKAIMDNFAFLRECDLDPNKLKITCWQGGKVYGHGINLKADVEKACSGPEFEKMRKEGIYIPRDDEAINAWKKCGVKDEQIVECGETGALNPSGFDAILLNAREHFAGVRSEPYYPVEDRHVEIGVYLSEEYIKKTVALRSKVPQEALEDAMTSDRFLLHLKARPVPAGFGCERFLMAVNGFTSVFQLEPYRALKEILVKEGDLGKDKEKIVKNTIAYIPAIAWLIHDGAHLLTTNAVHQRRGIYRTVLRTVIHNLRKLGLDYDDAYLQLFEEVINFYLQDEEYQTLQGLEKQCLEEIYKQKGRMKIEEKQISMSSH
jgi:alanyl-tRNA synthetase